MRLSTAGYILASALILTPALASAAGEAEVLAGKSQQREGAREIREGNLLKQQGRAVEGELMVRRGKANEAGGSRKVIHGRSLEHR